MNPSPGAREEILGHARNPRNHGPLPEATVRVHVSNPLCGDELELALVVDSCVIRAIRFQARGCSLTMAAASMLSGCVEGRTLGEARNLVKLFERAVLDPSTDEWPSTETGGLHLLLEVKSQRNRRKCVLLPFEALARCLSECSDSGPQSPERGAEC